MLKQITNLFMVYYIMRKLATPFEKWDAFKEGVIDQNGNILTPPDRRSQNQKNSMTLLDVMIMNLKKLLATIPGGSSKFATYASVLYLLREKTVDSIDIFLIENEKMPEWTDDYDFVSTKIIPLIQKYSDVNQSAKLLNSYIEDLPNKVDRLNALYHKLIGDEKDQSKIYDRLLSIFSVKNINEDGPVNVVGTGNIAGTTPDTIAVDKRKVKLIRRKKLENIDG